MRAHKADRETDVLWTHLAGIRIILVSSLGVENSVRRSNLHCVKVCAVLSRQGGSRGGSTRDVAGDSSDTLRHGFGVIDKYSVQVTRER